MNGKKYGFVFFKKIKSLEAVSEFFFSPSLTVGQKI